MPSFSDNGTLGNSLIKLRDSGKRCSKTGNLNWSDWNNEYDGTSKSYLIIAKIVWNTADMRNTIEPWLCGDKLLLAEVVTWLLENGVITDVGSWNFLFCRTDPLAFIKHDIDDWPEIYNNIICHLFICISVKNESDICKMEIQELQVKLPDNVEGWEVRVPDCAPLPSDDKGEFMSMVDAGSWKTHWAFLDSWVGVCKEAPIRTTT